MTSPDDERSGAARAAAELALVRVVHHYGGRPEFVLIGGLVPALLCSDASLIHAGTTDVDVQVDLEIAGGSANAGRLEQALRNAEFRPDAERVWRWQTRPFDGPLAVIKFELLADLANAKQGATVDFDGSEALGAANLRGTGYAARDVQVRSFSAKDHGTWLTVEVNTTGLAGFLLAKTAAAHGRHKPKDYYDIAYVLLHHDGPNTDAVARVQSVFELPQSMRTPLLDLQAQFQDTSSPGAEAYARQVLLDAPDRDMEELARDSVLAVTDFTTRLLA